MKNLKTNWLLSLAIVAIGVSLSYTFGAFTIAQNGETANGTIMAIDKSGNIVVSGSVDPEDLVIGGRGLEDYINAVLDNGGQAPGPLRAAAGSSRTRRVVQVAKQEVEQVTTEIPDKELVSFLSLTTDRGNFVNIDVDETIRLKGVIQNRPGFDPVLKGVQSDQLRCEAVGEFDSFRTDTFYYDCTGVKEGNEENSEIYFYPQEDPAARSEIVVVQVGETAEEANRITLTVNTNDANATFDVKSANGDVVSSGAGETQTFNLNPGQYFVEFNDTDTHRATSASNQGITVERGDDVTVNGVYLRKAGGLSVQANANEGGALVEGSNNNVVASYTFEATGEPVRIERLTIVNDLSGVIDEAEEMPYIGQIRLSIDGSWSRGNRLVNGGTTFSTEFTDLNLVIPADESVTVEVLANLKNKEFYQSGADIYDNIGKAFRLGILTQNFAQNGITTFEAVGEESQAVIEPTFVGSSTINPFTIGLAEDLAVIEAKKAPGLATGITGADDVLLGVSITAGEAQAEISEIEVQVSRPPSVEISNYKVFRGPVLLFESPTAQIQFDNPELIEPGKTATYYIRTDIAGATVNQEVTTTLTNVDANSDVNLAPNISHTLIK